VAIFSKRGTNGEPSDTQVTIVGRSDWRGLAMSRNLPLQQFRNGTNPRAIYQKLQADGHHPPFGLRCHRIAARRRSRSGRGAARGGSDWTMPTGMDAKTDVRLG